MLAGEALELSSPAAPPNNQQYSWSSPWAFGHHLHTTISRQYLGKCTLRNHCQVFNAVKAFMTLIRHKQIELAHLVRPPLLESTHL